MEKRLFSKTNFCCLIVLAGLCAPRVSTAAGLVAAWGHNVFGQLWVPSSVVDAKAIAAGEFHSLALNADGRVVAWGDPTLGITRLPLGLSDVRAIAAGLRHSVALRADGGVVAWGDNTYGQTNVPPGLSNVVAISAGAFHNLALRSDASVMGWGDVSGFQPFPADGLSNVKAVSAGGSHSLALKVDGRVVAWGANNDLLSNVPPGLSNVAAIAAGQYHDLALRADGTVVAWGRNDYGQATVPPGLSNVVGIAVGIYHSLALKADGSIVAWGQNSYGQTLVPVGLSNVTAIAAGGWHCLAVTSDGPVRILQEPESKPLTTTVTFSVVATGREPLSYRWYFNGSEINSNNARISGIAGPVLTITSAQYSDLGNYTVVVSNPLGSVKSSAAIIISPPIITQQPANRTVGAGADVTLSIAAVGSAPLGYQWLRSQTDLPGKTSASLLFANVQPEASGIYSVLVTNAYGSVLSSNAVLTVTNTAPSIVTQPGGDAKSTNVSRVIPVGGNTSLSVSARGSSPIQYQWRLNGTDLPGATNATLGLTNISYDQTGYYSVAVRNAFGEIVSAKVFLNVVQVYVWGESATGPPSLNTPTNVPPGLTNVIAVAAGSYHLLALRDDGRVATWASFQVTTGLTNVPASATNVMAIAAASDNNMVLRSNGTVIVWGNNSFGQTNVPESASNIAAIAAGGSHCLALRSNGTIIAWGNNSFGQATSPAGLSNVVAIAAGGAHSLALKTDGTIVAWGYNVSGQTNVPLSATNVIAIDADGGVSLALRANGTAVSWGNTSGSIPSNLTNLVATSVGSPKNVALKADGSIASWAANQTPPSPALSNVIAIAAGERGTFGAAVIGNGSPFFTIQPATQTTVRSNTVKLHARAVGLQPIKYQWQLDNVNLPAATNADLTIASAQGKDTGTYRCLAANSRGTNVSARAQLTIPYSAALPAALNATNLTWTTNLLQTPPWFAQIHETHDGDAGAQSGAITNNQSSVLQTTVTGPGTLTFWWKVSSEQSYDFLRFYLNNLTTPFRSISGETDWEKMTVTLTNALSYTLRWTYSKDISVSAGRDAGWLDEVIFTPNPPIIERQPYSQTVPLGATVTIPAFASSSTPMSYQWLKNGTNLASATAQYLTLTNVARRDSARYALRVFNAGGSVTSSNASLKVIVPQRLSGLRLLPDGSAELISGDLDGAPLLALDLPVFEAQTSTNLKDWTVLHDALIVTNDVLRLRDASRSNYAIRFYRIVEH